jgi:hypothetical protein
LELFSIQLLFGIIKTVIYITNLQNPLLNNDLAEVKFEKKYGKLECELKAHEVRKFSRIIIGINQILFLGCYFQR